ncbi:PrsW family intramembrane metalloprotease [bacterium]|nr:PrsW family intramembrane metalloprotease [Candidatus Elulimicrobium humile]
MFDYTSLIITIILAYIPSFAWLGFVLSQDVHPEKSTDIAKAFILGSFLAVPIVIFAVWGREILDILLITIPETLSKFIFGALAEEIIKGAFVYWFAISTSRWDEPIDTFIYAATLALGFAGIENLAYVLNDYEDNFDDIQQLLVLRSFTSLLIHMISSFLFTYGLTLYLKYHNKMNGIWLILAGIIFHGLWNLVSIELRVFMAGFTPIL